MQYNDGVKVSVAFPAQHFSVRLVLSIGGGVGSQHGGGDGLGGGGGDGGLGEGGGKRGKVG